MDFFAVGEASFLLAGADSYTNLKLCIVFAFSSLFLEERKKKLLAINAIIVETHTNKV